MIETRPKEEIRVRYDAVLAETIGIRGANDDEIEASTLPATCWRHSR